MSLRLRSILAAALATLIAVAVLGSAVDILVAGHLRRELDHTLRARAVSVAQLAASAPALLATPGSLDSAVGAAPSLVEVVDRRDRLIARSLSLGGRVLPVSIAQSVVSSGVGRYRTVDLGPDEVRVYAAPLADISGPAAGGALLVAASTSDVADTIHTLHVFTFLAAFAAAGAGALAVALLMRGALSPLARLDRAAGEIGRTGDPTQRLPGPARADEVGRLASTLNTMLDSLERSREAERRFVADASHELRTPLTALRGNVEHLARHGATPELVTDLQLDAERLARLADDLLALSREDAGTQPDGRVRLDELVLVSGANVVVTALPIEVEGDRAALERAVGNLLENAHRHGPPGGVVKLTVTQDGERAQVTVTDQGAGLTADEAERAFERFWRRGSESGSGLGLAIVRATAERHGGRAYGRGSSFTIELPVVRKASETRSTPVDEDLEKGSP